MSLGVIKYSHEVMTVVCAWRRSVSSGLVGRDVLHEESLDASRQRVAFWVAGADETDSLSVTKDR